LHPSGPEIAKYLYNVCEQFRILDKIQTDTDVTSIRWLDDEEEWELILEHMAPGVGDLSARERKALAESQGAEKVCSRIETIRAKVVASAVGGLVEPKPYPDVPGLDTFEGDVIHTARWDATVKLQDKNVVVLGSGCSAAQVTPEIIKPPHNAKSVTQLLRSPGWVHPTFPPDKVKWWEANTPTLFYRFPLLQWTARKFMFTVMEIDFLSYFPATASAKKHRQQHEKRLLNYMHKVVPEKYWEILTPDYEFGCKRRVIDTDWFRSLQNPKIDLTSLPLTSIQAHTVTLGPGRHYPPMSRTSSQAPTAERTIPCDVLIFANGYEAGEWLHPLDVRGRANRSLHDTWTARGGAQAYLGTAIDGFPNFFLIFGPNTATGHSSVILASENMVNYSLNFIKPILDGEVRTYEVKERAQRKWTADIQAALGKSVWQTGGCKSWYFNERTGWNSILYPWTQVHFTLRCMFPRYADWDVQYTSKGLLRKRLRAAVRLVGLMAAVAALVYARSYGVDGVLSLLRSWLRNGLDGVRGWL
jgi:cation diffusion facilitator CzcD-associated flavoprotein CzcO